MTAVAICIAVIVVLAIALALVSAGVGKRERELELETMRNNALKEAITAERNANKGASVILEEEKKEDAKTDANATLPDREHFNGVLGQLQNNAGDAGRAGNHVPSSYVPGSSVNIKS